MSSKSAPNIYRWRSCYTNLTSNNYIGKSNWENNETQYANKDERFRGALFDFRLYKTPMSQAKVDRTILWCKQKLFLNE